MLKFKSLAGLLITACSVNAFAANQPSNMILGRFTGFNSKHYMPFVLNANHDKTDWMFNTNFNGLPNDINSPGFTSAYCENKFCVLGGYYAVADDVNSRGNRNKALIYRSNDAGITWDTLDVTPANVLSASIDYVDCDQGKCFAIGFKRMLDHKARLFTVKSSNNFQSWQSTDTFPDVGARNSIEDNIQTCTDSYCVIAVTKADAKTDTEAPVFFYADKKDQNWSLAASPDDVPKLTRLDAWDISCNKDTCVVVGDLYKKNDKSGVREYPFLFVSHDKGATWQNQVVTDMPGSLYAVTCKSDFCIAAGAYSDEYDMTTGSLMAVSHDNGKSWQVKKLEQHEGERMIPHALACTDSFCAIGTWPDKNQEEMLISRDKGNSWKRVNISNQPDRKAVYMRGLSCGKDNCIGVLEYNYFGDDNNDKDDWATAKIAPLFSDITGEKWTVANMTNLPEDLRWTYANLAYNGQNEQHNVQQRSGKNSFKHIEKLHKKSRMN